ncbi:MAG: beta-N-acetylhexosaminidase [Clostridia bacterium]
MKIIPKPLKTEMSNGMFKFSASTIISCKMKIAQDELFFLDFAKADDNKITFVEKNTEYDYQIEIGAKEILVSAKNDEGAFHALMTLKQLVFEGYKDGIAEIPCCKIADKARFPYRGYMLDVSRHFFGIDTIKKIIDCLALCKMNVLHLHLSDNQGFRVESEVFPLLNKIGSKKVGVDENDQTFEYYKKAEVKEIVNYAAERFVEIIPEIDLPGHTIDMLASYPSLGCQEQTVKLADVFKIDDRIICASKKETYEFVFALLDEMCELFPSSTFHIGGDEAPKAQWKNCPHCQKLTAELGLKGGEELQGYFTNKVLDHLKEKGKHGMVWNEALNSNMLDKSATVQYWWDITLKNHIKAAAESGRSVVVSKTFKYYLDYNYGMTRLKDSYMFEPTKIGVSKKGKESIIGVEAPLWTEIVHSEDRLFYQTFPRLFAVAESGWSEGKKNYKDFEDRLYNILGIMQAYDLNFATIDECNPCPIVKTAATAQFFGKLNTMSIKEVNNDKQY